jgi:two-component system KDP operon response regulator KdpE
MATNRGKLLTHRFLLSRVWGPGYEFEREYLRVFVAQLRKKLEDEPQRPRWILTDPGVGYRWSPE